MNLWQLEPGYRAIERWVQACVHCGGAWVDRSTLEELVRNASAAAEAHGTPDQVPRRPVTDPVVYRGCPSCGAMMNRRNFGRISGVIVDECRTCGTWFDAGELEAMLEFVRAGGLTLSQQVERREVERETRQAKTRAAGIDPYQASLANQAELETDMLVAFGRWALRWLRRAR